MSSLTANYACPPVVCDHCTLRSSERVVPTSSAPLLTNQHETADVSFIDLRPIYQKSRGCGLQNCHPFLGVAITSREKNLECFLKAVYIETASLLWIYWKPNLYCSSTQRCRTQSLTCTMG